MKNEIDAKLQVSPKKENATDAKNNDTVDL